MCRRCGLSGVAWLFALCGVSMWAAEWHRIPARAGTEVAAPTPNSPDEPLATSFSLSKSAEFLDGVALDWTRKRQCGTCHTNYAYMVARPALPAAGSSAPGEIRHFFEGRVAHWDDPEPA